MSSTASEDVASLEVLVAYRVACSLGIHREHVKDREPSSHDHGSLQACCGPILGGEAHQSNLHLGLREVVEERRGLRGGIDTVLVLHSELMLQAQYQKAKRILRSRNTNLGHSLAEAPYHRMVLVVGQGSLCHSPGNRRWGPHLKVVPAQGADGRVILRGDGVLFRWSYAGELEREM